MPKRVIESHAMPPARATAVVALPRGLLISVEAIAARA